MKMESCFTGIILLVIMVSPSFALGPPALFVFGDSLTDVGNNNYLQAPAPKANFPFHGIDFPGKISTGRFGNGDLGIDYLAKYMGFQKSPPPYLSITNDNQTLKGINFASAGSGILDSTGNGTITLRMQVMYFEEVAGNLSRRVGNLIAKKSLSKSIFYLSTGSNDIFAYFLTLGPQNKTANDLFIAALLADFKLHLTTLYNSGARKIAVLGTSTIGCIPFVRSSLSPPGDCSEGLNNLSIQVKNETLTLLQNLALRLIGLKYSFIDAYEMSNQILTNAQQYGFTELLNACCGSGKFNAESPCTPNASLCSNRDNYFSWDQIHPTQAVAKLISQMSFIGSTHVTPMNIKRLVDS